MPSIASIIILLLSATTLYAQKPCVPPTIIMPTSNTNTPTAFTLAGTVVPGTSCANGLVRIMTQESGQIRLATTDSNGRFSSRLMNRPYGTQHYYLLHTSDNKETMRSNIVAITTICGVPSIIIPTANASSPTTVPHSRINITGYSDCPYVIIQNTNQSPITVATNANGAFNAQTKYLANGRYSISAVAASDTRGSNSAKSAERIINVQSSDPAPTVKRSQTTTLACLAGEETCLVHGADQSRRTAEYKCFSDLSTNIARCGSCSGPDCSALPNVKDVSCQEAHCMVHSCEKGFDLVGNTCI